MSWYINLSKLAYLMIPLFGFFNKFDVITKIIILPPHYSLEIDI